uniref:ATP synthase F0 subunit 8 n=1 Tax=Pseudoniphargus sp. 1-Portugal TaxID=2212668 RepID=A0A345K5R4_9CRUS|nr:ATP synthase F0 subunit 8 [Pseudoniphargus sp. 1-Portugal]
MPQMAPILWILFFVVFLLLTYTLMCHLFFSTSNKPTEMLNFPINSKFYWKW